MGYALSRFRHPSATADGTDLTKETAYRRLLMNTFNRSCQQARDRLNLDLRLVLRCFAQRDRVCHDHLLDSRIVKTLNCLSRQHRMRRASKNANCTGLE